jgi:fatty acid desaturase
LNDVPGRRRIWAIHMLLCAVVLAWVTAVCGIPAWQYVLEFVLPGTSLSLIRSFAEHRAALASRHRTAIVEQAPILGLLFLYNNLHVVHHLRPGLPWYAIPSWYAANRAALQAGNGGLVYRGYREVFTRYLFRPHDQVIHPFRGLEISGDLQISGTSRRAPVAEAPGLAETISY